MTDKSVERDEIEEISKNVVRNALNNMNDFEQEYDDEQAELANDENIDIRTSTIEHNEGRDVFFDKIYPCIEAGSSPTVEVSKDGAVIHSSKQKISWEWILHNLAANPKYGTGMYKVKARGTTGQFVGMQVKELQAPLVASESDKEAVKSGFNMDSMLQYMSESQRRSDEAHQRMMRELKEDKAESGNKQLEILTTLMASQNNTGTSDMMAMMMKSSENMVNLISAQNNNKGDDTTRLMMEMMMKSQDNTNNLMREMQQSTTQMIKDIDEKNQRNLDSLRDAMFSQSSSKEGDLSSFEMFKMMKESESSGFDQAKIMFELIEEKAKVQAENKKDDDGNESITSTLIKSVSQLAPLLAGAAAPPMPTQPQPQIEQPRRSLSQSSQQEASKRTSVIKTQASTIKKASIPTISSNSSFKQDQQNNTTYSELKTVKAEIVPDATIIEGAKKLILTEDEKRAMFDKAIPIITEALLSELPSSNCVTIVLDAIKNDIPAEKIHLLSEFFTAEFIFETAEKSGIMDIARNNGKENDINNWLTEFHVNLKEQTTL